MKRVSAYPVIFGILMSCEPSKSNTKSKGSNVSKATLNSSSSSSTNKESFSDENEDLDEERASTEQKKQAKESPSISVEQEDLRLADIDHQENALGLFLDYSNQFGIMSDELEPDVEREFKSTNSTGSFDKHFATLKSLKELPEQPKEELIKCLVNEMGFSNLVIDTINGEDQTSESSTILDKLNQMHTNHLVESAGTMAGLMGIHEVIDEESSFAKSIVTTQPQGTLDFFDELFQVASAMKSNDEDKFLDLETAPQDLSNQMISSAMANEEATTDFLAYHAVRAAELEKLTDALVYDTPLTEVYITGQVAMLANYLKSIITKIEKKDFTESEVVVSKNGKISLVTNEAGWEIVPNEEKSEVLSLQGHVDIYNPKRKKPNPQKQKLNQSAEQLKKEKVKAIFQVSEVVNKTIKTALYKNPKSEQQKKIIKPLLFVAKVENTTRAISKDEAILKLKKDRENQLTRIRGVNTSLRRLHADPNVSAEELEKKSKKANESKLRIWKRYEVSNKDYLDRVKGHWAQLLDKGQNKANTPRMTTIRGVGGVPIKFLAWAQLRTT